MANSSQIAKSASCWQDLFNDASPNPSYSNHQDSILAKGNLQQLLFAAGLEVSSYFQIISVIKA
jgi:hypothetical protein